ncbi:VOC family protein [Leptospira ilyithenensis]|uniref:VOC family protein n=1 Tax=Leptospira ilyithenensis TaxID=2484901 RepID=A0A4R9LR17_9LEPT|nr:VOC family protein [Leptospira ilyithenensis]TGN08420.1 VOC family protein [Leptospira ilyithenensis]
MIRFYSVNLFGGEDTRIASSFYKRLFGWKSVVESEGHSELFTGEGMRIVFSRIKPGCNVDPGTITLEVDGDSEQFLSEFRKEEYETEKSTPFNTEQRYVAYLDPWGNRIWIYRKSNPKN